MCDISCSLLLLLSKILFVSLFLSLICLSPSKEPHFFPFIISLPFQLAKAVPMSGIQDREPQLRTQTTVDIENRLV